MSHNAAESPPPLSQNTKPNNELSAVKALLRSYKWILESYDFTDCETLMQKMMEKAESNIKGITSVTTSQAKKKDWEIMRAATLVTMNTFTAKWEHQAFQTMAGRMEERVDRFLQARGEAGEILQIDEEKLCSKITEALERKFEAKLAEMAGVSSSLKLSDETAFTQIVADRV
ncbi:hypothetical protein BT96DRAFT_999227 [Gymnopus androsaceus JB14]|uniref:Uncharacterized protein n=1 Tax=Gymnopus androsaceus JB14 TaxID=1447944 RepID=A0A6A4H647_9AGAR|nr:hypothetical protein BT96DRAFT_999227 [Gymnopus androsaceus JB14]